MPKKTDPLTPEEMSEAMDIFYPLYQIIDARIQGATVEDKLKIMENVAKLGHKLRKDKEDEKKALEFGFNKNDESKTDKVQS